MADFSQAITNGFNIAIGLRRQKMQEEGMRLDEAYRRDSLAENKRQFGLDYELRDRNYKRGVFESDRDHSYRLERDKVEDQHWDKTHQLAVNSDNRDAERLRLVKDEYESKKRDAQNAPLARLIADRIAAGEDPRPLFQLAAGGVLHDTKNLEDFGEAVADNKHYFKQRASADGAPLNMPVFTETGVQYVGKDPKTGKLTRLTENRNDPAEGKPGEMPHDQMLAALFGYFGQSPTSMSIIAEGLLARGWISPEQAAAAGDGGQGTEAAVRAWAEGSAKDVAERDAAKAQQPAAPQTPGGDLSLESLSLAQRRRYTAGLNGPGTGITPESTVERAARAVVNRAYDAAETAHPRSEVPAADDGLADVNWKDRVGTWFNNRQRENRLAANKSQVMLQREAAARNMQVDPLAEVVRAYDEEKAKGAAADPRRLQALEQRMQAEMAAREKAAAPPPAADAAAPGSQEQAAAPQRGAAPPAAGLAAPPGEQRAKERLDLWRASQVFGTKPTMADLATLDATGIPSSQLVTKLIDQQIQSRKVAAKDDETALKRQQAFFGAAGAAVSRFAKDNKYVDEGIANDDMLLADEYTGGALGANPRLMNNVAARVVQLQRVGGRDMQAPDLQPYRVTAALASVNAGVDLADEKAREAMIENLQKLVRSTEGGMTPAKLALTLEGVMGSRDDAQQAAVKQRVAELSDDEAEAAVANGGIRWLVAKMRQGG